MLLHMIGDERITKILMESGVNVNAEDIFGNTALHDAVEGGKFKVL